MYILVINTIEFCRLWIMLCCLCALKYLLIMRDVHYLCKCERSGWMRHVQPIKKLTERERSAWMLHFFEVANVSQYPSDSSRGCLGIVITQIVFDCVANDFIRVMLLSTNHFLIFRLASLTSQPVLQHPLRPRSCIHGRLCCDWMVKYEESPYQPTHPEEELS